MTYSKTNMLKITNITKSYPNVIANDSISLNIETGQIHALLGENGAGKSTLVKIIYGLVKQDSGEMYFNNVSFNPENPKKARLSGVGMVFQHFSLFDALTVSENVLLGIDGLISSHSIEKEIITISNKYGLPINPKMTVGNLSAGERQRIEIVRCLLQKPKLLIMDEPTSVLTPNEIEQLFKTLKKLASLGTSILYISHKLEEVRALCDKATILRNGQVVKHCIPEKITSSELAELMVGKKILPTVKIKATKNKILLQIKNLSLDSKNIFGTNLKNIDLNLHKGEILGIGGVAGSGQDELMSVLTGEQTLRKNILLYNGNDIGKLNPRKRREIGLLTAPEERLGHAAAPDMDLIENCLITSQSKQNLSKNGWIDYNQTKKFAESIIKKFDVRTTGAKRTAKTLSGGNLQKFLMGRELIQKPSVFVVNQPTWGVDASAAQFIRQALLDLVSNGSAIIVISQDLDELIEISDNFTALVNGRLSEPKQTNRLSVSEIGLMLSTEKSLSK